MWLKAPERIAFKCAVLVYKCLHGSAPSYLIDELCQVADAKARQRLRSSSSSSLIVSRTWLSTVGDRAFPVAAACVWNMWLPHLLWLSCGPVSRHICLTYHIPTPCDYTRHINRYIKYTVFHKMAVFLSFITQSNGDKFKQNFSSCSWRNTNSKYLTKMWLLVKYSFLVHFEFMPWTCYLPVYFLYM